MTLSCDFCGSTKQVYRMHPEEHIKPPRVVDICRACHQSIHSRRFHGVKHFVTLSDEVYEELKRYVKETYHGKSGGLSIAVEDALREFLKGRGLKKEVG